MRFKPAVGSSEKGRIDFLDYDKTFTLAKPPASQVVDIAEMSSGG